MVVLKGVFSVERWAENLVDKLADLRAFSTEIWWADVMADVMAVLWGGVVADMKES